MAMNEIRSKKTITGTNFTEAELIVDTIPGKPVSGILVMPERVGADGVGYYAERAS